MSSDGGDREDVALTAAEVEEGALSAGGAIDVFARHRLGYLGQYFAVGLIYGGLPATVYGVFIGYLNVPAYVYTTVFVVITMPWSFKFVFGAMNDCFPIRGYRRKPYMCLGWCVCAFMLLVIASTPLPPPYWCRDADGRYVTTRDAPGGGKAAAEPCNREAASAGGRYALLMMGAALGYVVADVAADGLTVQYGRREGAAARGQTQSMAYLVRTLGQVGSSLLVGFGMNGREYNGTFRRGLSFNAVCMLLALPAAAMVPISWLYIDEPAGKAPPAALREYLNRAHRFLSSRAVFHVVMYNFCSSAISSISTTAGGAVKNYWAGVQNLQNQLFSIFGSLLFAYGLWLVRSRFLAVSWRGMLLTTTLLLNLIDMPFAFCTIFGVVRNQYFYLGETVLVEVPAANPILTLS